MERILNDNEKIRKAEEIYYRRNHRNINISQNMEPKKQKTYLGSKILLEMLILLISAVAVFAVKNKDYIFTENFLNSLAEYNVNITQKFNGVIAKLRGEEIQSEEDIKPQEEQINPQAQSEKTETVEVQAEENPVTAQESLIAPNDTNQFIKPIEGIITSGFGVRESAHKNVSGNHTGIDIAADSGTEIKSAMSGVVTQVSSEGDYGNHIRITKDNITTLYAHCQDILVQEGQEIAIGQVIATVGSTGNSTGPHLHFEIRIDDQPINPTEIIEF